MRAGWAKSSPPFQNIEMDITSRQRPRGMVAFCPSSRANVPVRATYARPEFNRRRSGTGNRAEICGKVDIRPSSLYLHTLGLGPIWHGRVEARAGGVPSQCERGVIVRPSQLKAA